jgi:NAD(P)-dependent dehydrogenase (short-subunit alcohol dehydrogenase family)
MLWNTSSSRKTSSIHKGSWTVLEPKVDSGLRCQLITRCFAIMVAYLGFDADRDIPDLSSKVIVVTGGNSGVGKESILQLSKHKPAKLYMTARSKAKYDAAILDIKRSNPDANITFLELDLASFASVKMAASTLLAENTRLDILMANTGIMAVPPSLTKDGFKVKFGTNHLSHALFTKLLTPLLLKTAETPGSDVRAHHQRLLRRPHERPQRRVPAGSSNDSRGEIPHVYSLQSFEGGEHLPQPRR